MPWRLICLLPVLAAPEETNFLSSYTAESAREGKKENSFLKIGLSCLSLKCTSLPIALICLSWDAQIATRSQRNDKDAIFNHSLEAGPPPPGRRSSCFVVFQSSRARITQHPRNKDENQKPQKVTRTVDILVFLRRYLCNLEPKGVYSPSPASVQNQMRFTTSFCSSDMKFPLGVKIQSSNLQWELVSYTVLPSRTYSGQFLK